jgi:hypothetical protein
MPKEPEDEIGTLAESRKATIHLRTEFVHAGRSGMAKMLFDIAVAALLGVHVRGVRREPFHVDLGMLGEILLHDECAMRTEPVPNDDEGPRNTALEVAEGSHNIVPADGMLEVPLVDAAR